MKVESFQGVAAPAFVIVAGILIWQAACWLIGIPNFILPSPTLIAAKLWEFRAIIAFHAVSTLWISCIGFSVALFVGTILGVGIGTSRLLYQAFYPLLIAFNSVPKVAIVPLLIIWFGTGAVPAVTISFLTAFLPIAVNLATGMSTIEPEMRDVLRAVGARRSDIIWKVGIPHSAPYFFASLKIAFAMAFVGTVISETVASDQGIGYLMMSASSRLDTPLVFAGLIVVSAMGIGIYALFAILEARLTSWTVRARDAAFAT